MIIPRPLRGLNVNPLSNPQDFALCFNCHNKYEVLSQTGAPGATNFWNNDSSPSNSHNLHLGINSYHADTDFDSGHDIYGSERNDSSETCITCHNVHGSPTRAMIRHGELISQYNVPSSATWSTPSAFNAGAYYVYAHWTGESNRASNARYTINFNGGNAQVSKDQRFQGGKWVLLGIYDFAAGNSGSVVLDNEYADGYVIADAIGWDSDGALDPDPEVIVDNTDATYEGYWTSSTVTAGCYGTNYQYQPKMRNKIPSLNFSYLINDVDIATATWSAPGGSYYVYAWWSAYTNRATNAKYTVNHTGGTDTFTVNQQIDGGKWNQLGTTQYDFVSGNSVVLSNDGVDGYVIADAIGLDTDGVFTGDPAIVIDNPEAIYDGVWTTASSNTDKYGADVYYHAMQGVPVSDPDATLEESVGGYFNYPSAQTNMNGVCRACHNAVSYIRTPNLSPRVIMLNATPGSINNNETDTVLFSSYVYSPDDTISSVTINLTPIGGSATQTMYDDGTNGDAVAGDNIYSYRTTVPETVDTGLKKLTVTGTDSQSRTGNGDINLMVANPGWTVVDNWDADFNGYWTYSTSGDIYNRNTKYHAAGSGTNTAIFTPVLSQTGNYNVYAWWTEYSNRATNAPYTINHSGSSDMVRVNQRVNGGQFVYLGTYNFDAQAGPTSVIVDNKQASFTGVWSTSFYGEYYGDDLQYIQSTATGSNSATFTPDLPQAGNYDVYAWWTVYSNRAQNVPYIIKYSGGATSTVRINQELGGGGWTYLGTYYFDAGTSGNVEISDDAELDEYVIADAIKWQLSSMQQGVVLSDDADGYVMGDAILFEPAD